MTIKQNNPLKSRSDPQQGAGLGLRRGQLMQALEQNCPAQIDFFEVAPENWIPMGGELGKRFRAFTERYPFVLHGLSLSIGSPAPLDEAFVRDVKTFMHDHQISGYSEHLSYCSDQGHLYDLLPIPFTEEAVNYVADRISRVQDILGQRIAIENASYYAAPGQALSEIDFINAILEKADCELLLDINNVYVNSVNHRYDAREFLQALPAERIAYGHIAGHYNEADDLIIDTHGADVIDPVWQLLDEAYDIFGVFPTLLERDFNIPPLAELIQEVDHIKQIQHPYQRPQAPLIANDIPDFQQIQYAFTAHIREPDKIKKPDDVSTRRMAIYNELLFNNVRGFLETSFPVLHSIYDKDNWTRLAQAFFAHHHSTSPYFVDIPKEFIDFLQTSYQLQDSDPDFLLEFAHYEWIELVLSISKAEVDNSLIDPQGDLLSATPSLSPLAQCLNYSWPVHQISKNNLPTSPQASSIIVYRDHEDKVQFIEANPVLARLFELLESNDERHTGQALLAQIGDELQHPDPQVVIQGGLQMLQKLHDLGIVLGVYQTDLVDQVQHLDAQLSH